MWQVSNGHLERLAVFTCVCGEIEAVGELIMNGGGGRRSSFFRYAASWLKQAAPPALFPVGLPRRRKVIPSDPHPVPLQLCDAGPDGWGKQVLDAAYPGFFFGTAEYLAAAGADRTGELLFGPTPEEGPQRWVPSNREIGDGPARIDELEAMLAAARAFEAGDADDRQLGLLLRSGTNIGGARPKIRLRDEKQEWIAKFPADGDRIDDPRMEAFCLSLAKVCGIETPDHKLLDVAGQSVLLVARFDRDQERRLGYLSAASVVGQSAVIYSTDVSYAGLAEAARKAGMEPCAAELFRRLLFNCVINNADDHLRNHAFIRDVTGWRLSPVFDLVPSYGDRLVLRPAPGEGRRIDARAALSTYGAFGLTSSQARSIWQEIEHGLSNTSELLEEYGNNSADCERLFAMAPELLRFHRSKSNAIL